MSINRRYEETALKQFLDGKGQSMETFEKEVIDALRRFMIAYQELIAECLLTADRKGVYVTMSSRTADRDDTLIDAQSNLELELADNGWPEVHTFTVPAGVDAEDFTRFAANSLQRND